jgi:amino acid transporter
LPFTVIYFTTLTKAVLYIFFKFYLKSKIVPLKEVDFQSEFDAIEQEKASGEYVPEPERVWWKRWIHLF